MKKNQPYKVQHALEDGEFPVLHLSNAVLAQNSATKKEDGRTVVTISMKANGDSTVEKDLKNLVIATLCPEKKDQVSLDLYINVSQNITIACQGEGEVHLSGYFEPNNSLEDQMLGAGGVNGFSLDDDEDDEDEQIEIDNEEVKNLQKDAQKTVSKLPAQVEKKSKDVVGFTKGGDLDKSLKDAKKNAVKNAGPKSGQESGNLKDWLKQQSSDDEDEDSEDEDSGSDSSKDKKKTKKIDPKGKKDAQKELKAA